MSDMTSQQGGQLTIQGVLGRVSVTGSAAADVSKGT
jgi:hypothetical protein